MSDQMLPQDAQKTAKRALWASSIFYVLIAFEFFYMASPFAAYFYTVYGPGLDWLQGSQVTNWTIQFFLPHLVEASKSSFVGMFEIVGLVMFLGGLLAFAAGVVQIYRAKLLKQDAVVKGLYRYIRHPQYLALIIASIGMLFVWPRFLVLFGTISVIFIYIALAKAEEGICKAKYPGYDDYMKQTGMFLPKGWIPSLPFTLSSKPARFAGWIVTFVATLLLATLAAQMLRTYAIASFYALETENAVYLSTVEISDADLARIAEIASASAEAQPARDSIAAGESLLNYVLPTNMYVSEIPMHLPEGEVFGHSVPSSWDETQYKVVMTKAEFGGAGLPDGEAILEHAVNKFPLIELWVDLTSGEVTKSYPAPAVPFYGNHQVPLF